MSLAILDGDVIAYVASLRETKEVQMSDEVTTGKDALESAIVSADHKVAEWTKMSGAATCVLALSGGNNFRKEVHPEYKSQRLADKPENYSGVLAHLNSKYRCVSHPNLEGDDLLGLWLTSGVADIAVSTDKDIFTLPGKVLRVRLKGPQMGPVVNTEFDADKYWMTQVLTGDAVDGYKGCPGCGPKRAEVVLKDCRSLSQMWGAVVEEYRRAALKPKTAAKFVGYPANGYKEALMNARCARILRDGDYNIGREEVYLWETP